MTTPAAHSAHNISRSEAQQRSAILDTASYDVTVDVSGTEPTFPTTTTVHFTCRAPGAHTWIDLVAAAVHSITLNGRAIDPATAFDGTRIALDDLAADNELTIVADGTYMRTGEGLHRFVDPVDNETYLYTQFESADARRMYACFEQPDLKATFQLTVVAPDHWQVLSNSPTPTRTILRPGVARWNFAPSLRMSTYITALVAGPYAEFRDEYAGPNGTYPLGMFCRRSLAEYLDHDEIFLVTKQGFAYFESVFGTPYPFGKYDQIFTAEYNWGAMENAGCVTINEDYIFRSRTTDLAYEQRANTVLHELAHMWFGNLVTMRWWDDLWLNESFAEWAASQASMKATRYTNSWTAFNSVRKSWAYRQDQLPSTHPIAADMVDLDAVRTNFDGITYAKGAAALRQLVAWVGEEEFLAGLRTYFATYAWGNTELSDLLTELEKSSGRDLSSWTAEWLQTSGVNLLRPRITVDADGRYTSVSITQEPPSSPAGLPATLRSHRIRLGLYDRTADGLVRRDTLELDVAGAHTDVPALTGVTQPDLLLLNDDDLTFAKVRLDDRSWRTAVEAMGGLDNSLARSLIWGSAWDMTRDAEVPFGDYLELALAGLLRETDITLVQMTLRQVRTGIDTLAAPALRAGYLERLAATTLAWARESEPSSDHQLACARTFATSCLAPAHLDTLAALLDGSESIPGLAIDTDLRWLFLQRLVVMGRLGDKDIAAELERDNTAAGNQQATFVRASRPTAQAKAEAWTSATTDLDLPNTLLESALAGFQQRDQLELLVPYRERYFAEVVDVWERRTAEMASSVATIGFPAQLIDETTVAMSEEFLARGVNASLARIVSEQADAVRRALRARARDGA